MRCALIMPPALNGYVEFDSPGRSAYHLLLAHEVLKNTPYFKMYDMRHTFHDYMILDNMAYEDGASCDYETLQCAINLMRPNEIVLPDVLHNASGTIEQAKKFYRRFQDDPLNFILRPTFMAVPQGQNLQEWAECLQTLIHDIPISCVGISRINETFPEGLEGCYQVLRAVDPRVQIHLLGLGNDLTQYLTFFSNHYSDIRGIDTAKPFTYTFHGVEMSQEYTSKYRRPDNFFWLRPENFDHGLLLRNVQYYYSLFR